MSGRIQATMGFSRRIEWHGGRATAYLVKSGSADAFIQPRCLEAIFCFNSRRMEGEYSLPGSPRVPLAQGRQAWFVPADVALEWRVKSAVHLELLVLQLDHDFVKRCAGLERLPTFDGAQTWDYTDALGWDVARAIYDDCTNGTPGGTSYARAAATFLSAHIIRALTARRNASQSGRHTNAASAPLRRACDFMVAHLDDGELTLTQVADIAGLSVSHFLATFRQSMGVSPFEWLRSRRMARAKEMLRDPMTDLTSVALAVGYANQSAFGVAFKRASGITASRWRRLHSR